MKHTRRIKAGAAEGFSAFLNALVKFCWFDPVRNVWACVSPTSLRLSPFLSVRDRVGEREGDRPSPRAGAWLRGCRIKI